MSALPAPERPHGSPGARLCGTHGPYPHGTCPASKHRTSTTHENGDTPRRARTLQAALFSHILCAGITPSWPLHAESGAPSKGPWPSPAETAEPANNTQPSAAQASDAQPSDPKSQGRHASPADAADRPEPLPAPALNALRHSPPTPQWDVGLQVGVCGVGKSQLWAGTDFCGALVIDALFLRRRASSPGIGPYATVGTSGFFDARWSAGFTAFLPLSELLGLQGRVGPLLVTASDGGQGGIDANVELLVRGLRSNGHYAMANGLSVGIQHAPGSLSRAGTAILIQLRLDALWFLVPTTWLR